MVVIFGATHQSSTVHSTCNDSFNRASSQVFHCSMGCHYASSLYFQSFKERIGIPGAPTLIAGSRSHSSIELQWEGVETNNVTYLVQCKYSDIPSEWEYCQGQDGTPSSQTNRRITNLKPYTSYMILQCLYFFSVTPHMEIDSNDENNFLKVFKILNFQFRVAWIALPDQEPLMSKESIDISTTAHGGPETAPEISSLTALDPTRVSIMWDRPLFPNGAIVAYVLDVQKVATYESESKEVSDLSDSNFYIWSNLEPDTEYEFSVAAQNNEGTGPSSFRTLRTPALHEGMDSIEPYIILAASYKIMKQTLSMVSFPEQLYQSSNSSISIKGLSLHVKLGLMFLSDSSGYVYKMSLENKALPIGTIISKSPFYPQALSVDWLNNKLYLAEKNQISRCDLDGKGYKIVISGIEPQPTDLQVDPYNGFLYWAVHGIPNGGIYQIDLASLGKVLLHQRDSRPLLKDYLLSAFAIDYKKFSILYPDELDKTMMSMSLYGDSTAMNIRRNMQASLFHNIISIASHKELFYWTDGEDLLGEQYHHEEKKYYHNAFSLVQDKPLSRLNIYHPSSQPYPVPLTQVTNVQAIFGTEMAKIFWKKPTLLRGLGHGAWQNWKYEIWVTDHSRGLTIYRSNITDLNYNLYNLKESTRYSIKVLAHSAGGKGPWSDVFTGQTFKKGSNKGYPYMLWSSQDGLVKANIVGDEVESLLSSLSLNNSVITDIAWHGNLLIFTTNASQVYSYDINSLNPLQHLRKIKSASSIAFDWLGKKIYWSNAEQQVISKCNADGTEIERLPLMVMARKLSVDSLRAYLYWISPHSVECSRLNGEDRFSYFQIGLFSGKQLMGLTLDFDQNKVYWMVRSYEGASLYQASLAGDVNSPVDSVKLVSILPVNNVIGPVWYFSDRLYWLHDVRGIMISDMDGQNVSTVHGYGTKGPKAFAVIDPRLHPSPEGRSLDDTSVIPKDIDTASVKIQGNWDNFNITWDPITSVNYGKLQYTLLLNSEIDQETFILDKSSYTYPNPQLLKPFSPLNITLQASTLWGTSKKLHVSLNSPMSIPSAPVKPRVYISYKRSPLQNKGKKQILADLRWHQPQHPNGIILGYKISCWMLLSSNKKVDILTKYIISPSARSYVIPNLLINQTYYFQVSAFTSIGDGPDSMTTADTSEENHVPLLLLTTSHAVELTDIDNQEDIIVADHVDDPVDVGYLTHEKLIFWLDDIQGLMMTNMSTNRSAKVAEIKGKGTSLTIDWVGRFLYWSENTSQRNSIWKLDLSSHTNNRFTTFHAIEILNVPNRIGTVEVNPFSGHLLWTEIVRNNLGLIKVSDTNGKDVEDFFKYESTRRKRNTKSDDCNCSRNVILASSMSLDWSSETFEPKVVWADGEKGHIWSADLSGCKCNILVNASETVQKGLPPSSVTVDHQHIYWSNHSLGKIFMLKRKLTKKSLGPGHEIMSLRREMPIVETTLTPGVRNIIAVGAHLQRYPDLPCLAPRNDNKPQFKNHTSNSITLYIPSPKNDPQKCGNVSIASMKFIIHYKKFSLGSKSCVSHSSHPDILCSKIITHESIVTIRNLEPYTNYSFQVVAINAYTAPSAPGHVSAIAVSPYQIDIKWTEPEILLSPSVTYEIHWSNNGSKKVMSTHSNHSPRTETVNGSKKYLEASLISIMSSQTYEIKVRVVADDKKYTDSDIVLATTYDEPNNITEIEVTSNQLVLQWISPKDDSIKRHLLQFKEEYDDEWTEYGFQMTQFDNKYNYTLRNLNPKSRYSVRLGIKYLSDRIFYWPSDDRFIFLTLGDKPSKPGVPLIKNIAKDVHQVEWKGSNNHGGEMLYYILDVQQMLTESSEPIDELWTNVYNGSDKIWIISNLTLSEFFIFRVAAVNNYGMSGYSVMDDTYFLPGLTVLAQRSMTNEIALGSAVAIIIIVAIVFFVIAFLVQRKRMKEKELKHTQLRVIRGPDLELATLRELPNQGNFIHQTNTLYAVDDIPSDEELALLPQIRRDQIDLSNFLGSGAFGEVFEGIAQFSTNSDARVAIKTLRKGATDQEKAEFLKEAKLMSNFKHEHIISLLGLCLDNDPNLIIIELMDGGDLLSFLRSNRPTTFSPNTLTLQDVIGISVDVAKGCKYLEEMHFVHRDLAARNCLVSSYDPQLRIVKIGDFGLARDIYKNDYYRKEGEGLLPVRWMAPESLVDGVFTSQSDIWAFGVLLWEVMTLGQQPYPARTNLEVLQFVRDGGRLDKPDNCPDDLHQLMLKCWSYLSEDRPAFKLCLEQLEELKRKSADIPLTIVHNSHYIGRAFAGGVDNLAYSEDEMVFQSTGSTDSSYKQNSGESKLSLPLLKRHSDTFSVSSDPSRLLNGSFGNETVKRAVSCDPCSLHQLHVCLPEEPRTRWSTTNPCHPDDPPKYLELVQEDWNGMDGYEVPLPAPSSKSLSSEIAAVLKMSRHKPAAKPPPLNYSELHKTSSSKSIPGESAISANPNGALFWQKYPKPLKTPESADSMFTSSSTMSPATSNNSPLTSAVNRFFNSDYLLKQDANSTDYFSNNSSLDSLPTMQLNESKLNQRHSGISNLSSLSEMSVVDGDLNPSSSDC
ncbi:Proto-oncogene tyrosine-protein kinase ROS [Nymphon striatum]|nr:Proto-oncogene tyrosine-protein kinase ROS [Nymphon striatum]